MPNTQDTQDTQDTQASKTPKTPITAHADEIKEVLTSSVRTALDASRHYADTHPNTGAVGSLLGRAGAFLGAMGSTQNRYY